MHDSLLEFHKKWYSSNIMTLTVKSKHEIDSLEKWVTEKFSPVVNKDVVVPDLADPHPYPVENLGKLVKFVPV
jgi:insulysin